MGLKVLIVEDLFIEANDLRIILEKAGHFVSGIAKSVDQALASLQNMRPDVVLLDIFLKGNLTGIDLAKKLSASNIPFVYLSANSDEQTFELAKATKPYGFLVKPFREKDVLTALDIASYRHHHMVDSIQKQESWLGNLLLNISNEMGNAEQKLLLLAKTIQPFIYFDYLLIDLKSSGEGPGFVYAFKRIDFDHYEITSGWTLIKNLNITISELNGFRKEHDNSSDIIIRDGDTFEVSFLANKVNEKLHQLYNIHSSLSVPLPIKDKIDGTLCFFNAKSDSYRRFPGRQISYP